MSKRGEGTFPGGFLLFIPPDAYKTETELELQMQHRPEQDTERYPRKRPGDKRLFSGLLTRAVIGAEVGFGVSYLVGAGPPIVPIVPGATGGGVVGVLIAGRNKKN